MPATYWDGASAFIRHAANVEGSFDKLKGKKIGLVHLDAPYGKEPNSSHTTTASSLGSIRFRRRRWRTKAHCGLKCGAIGSTGSICKAVAP